MKYLMSVDNPEGFKLEEILQGLLDDLTEKQTGVLTKLGFDSTPCDKALTDVLLSAPVQQRVLAVMYCHNNKAIAGLQQALEAQLDTMRLLDGFGKDQGPYGKPRV